MGLGKAIELANKNIEVYHTKLTKLRDSYMHQVFEKIPNVRLNGHPEKRLPGNANMTFEGVEVGALLLMLSANGIYASGGSACNSKSTTPSHVLTAIGCSREEAKSTLRATFGEDNTTEEVDYVVAKLQNFVERLRK